MGFPCRGGDSFYASGARRSSTLMRGVPSQHKIKKDKLTLPPKNASLADVVGNRGPEIGGNRGQIPNRSLRSNAPSTMNFLDRPARKAATFLCTLVLSIIASGSVSASASLIEGRGRIVAANDAGKSVSTDIKGWLLVETPQDKSQVVSEPTRANPT